MFSHWLWCPLVGVSTGSWAYTFAVAASPSSDDAIPRPGKMAMVLQGSGKRLDSFPISFGQKADV
jgi:hypothetical protein